MSDPDVIVGIDLGTTNSLVGLVDTGFPVLIPDGEGKRLFPSCVRVTGLDSPPVTGWPAKRSRGFKPEETVLSIKRYMGRRWSELAEDEKKPGFALAEGPGDSIRVPLHGREWTPEEISAEILKPLRERAARYLGREVVRAVITVPAYFHDGQRAATKRAGELAGFRVERILNEPTAAAMAFGYADTTRKMRLAVFDFGGGTFDLSVLELNRGVFQVLSTHGNTRLGGDDLDRLLAAELGRRFRGATGREPDALWSARLLEEAEAAKIRLSGEASTRVELPFVDGGGHFTTEVPRAELERMAAPLAAKIEQHCRRALADAGIDPAGLDEVLMVGGMTRMPFIRALASKIFGREPNVSVNPDEAVALGAAVQAGILSGAIRELVLLDVTPLSLGIETYGGLMNVLIPRNTTIPVKRGEQFTNAAAGQSSMLVHVLQGERELARDNWSLGRFEIPFTPGPRGSARVGVQFEIDSDGILHVLARDLAGGGEVRVDLQSAVDVDDREVEKMVRESVDHAFEDMEARRFIEAAQKAERVMASTRSALKLLASRLEPAEVARIEADLRVLEEALQGKVAEPVRNAIRQLDESTARLADLLMEEVVDKALGDKRMP